MFDDHNYILKIDVDTNRPIIFLCPNNYYYCDGNFLKMACIHYNGTVALIVIDIQVVLDCYYKLKIIFNMLILCLLFY